MGKKVTKAELEVKVAAQGAELQNLRIQVNRLTADLGTVQANYANYKNRAYEQLSRQASLISGLSVEVADRAPRLPYSGTSFSSTQDEANGFMPGHSAVPRGVIRG